MVHTRNARPPAVAAPAAGRTAVGRDRRLRRQAAALAAVAVSLGVIAAAAPGAQAASHAVTPNGCIHTVEQDSAVYDSYNHYEGDIQLISSTCNSGWVGQFVGNSNTWKTVTVYVEYAYTYGFLQSPVYGYASNAVLQSPWYHGTSCYYAEVDLVDNRGNDNWVGTSNAGPGC